MAKYNQPTDDQHRKLISVAQRYEELLSGNNILFITSDKDKVDCFECEFNPQEYKHLTGVQTELNAVDFYKKCVDQTLAKTEYTIDRLSAEKVKVLNVLPTLEFTSRMAGDFLMQGKDLNTDKLVGTTTAAVGFRHLGGDRHVANTLLNGDIRDFTSPTARIILVYKKEIGQELYGEPSHVAKGINPLAVKLPEKALAKLGRGQLTPKKALDDLLSDANSKLQASPPKDDVKKDRGELER